MGTFSTRWLCAFKPRPGTELALEELRRLEELDMPGNCEEEDGEMDMAGLDTLWG